MRIVTQRELACLCRRWSTVHTVRVSEASELIAADVFTAAEQTRQWLTFADAPSSGPARQAIPQTVCGRCGFVPSVTAQRVYAIASGWQRQVRATRVRALS